MAQRRMVAMRAWIWSAVACGSAGPPQVWRSSAWMTACGWPVRWLQAPTRPLSSLRWAASCWRVTGGAACAAGAGGGTSLGGGRGPGGKLGLLALAEQGPDLVGFEQAGQAEEILLLRRPGRGGGAELAAVVEDPVEVDRGVEGLEGGLVHVDIGRVALALGLG